MNWLASGDVRESVPVVPVDTGTEIPSMSELLRRAIARHQSGDLDEAERLYRDALREDNAQADAKALLGLVLGAKNRHEEAIACASAAVGQDPDSPLLQFYHGNVMMNAGKLTDAMASFRNAIKLKPDFAQAWYNLANAQRAAGGWSGAIESYQAAIRINPEFAEAYNNLALCLVRERNFDEALRQAHTSVACAASYGEGWRTLCNIAEQTGDYELARAAGERCVALMPGSHFAWFGYGVALSRLNRFEEALECYKKALTLKPDRADIWDNLGQTYQSLNRLDEAEAAFRKTIEVAGQVIPHEEEREVAEEEYGNRHWHLALMELLRGKYKQGFARYRARFQEVGGLKRPPYSRPLWKGEALQGKTILVNDEQGFGDTLMLCRYIPMLRKLGARIKLAVHPALAPLFQRWPEIDEVLVHNVAIGDYDCYASVFDLPHLFATELETVPASIPYLPLPEPDESTRLPARAQGEFRIGVVWGGSPLHKNDGNRSIPLSIFRQLFDRCPRGVRYYSLNRDMKSGDEELLPQLNVADLAPKLSDFAASARLARQMDLIVTCDTATAHLAGGLGLKVWTLLPFAPDWRWLTGRSDSAWYPQMRLFRQPASGDWISVMRDVRQALESGHCKLS